MKAFENSGCQKSRLIPFRDLVKLKPKDIHSVGKLIHIKGAEGWKDRYSILSDSALKILRKYWKEYKPKKWLFPGARPSRHLHYRSVVKVLSRACEKAGISKDATVYTLRCSFAPHLDTGTDLRLIQELLGHKSAKTTEIYTHVCKSPIGNIVSPLDCLDER